MHKITPKRVALALLSLALLVPALVGCTATGTGTTTSGGSSILSFLPILAVFVVLILVMYLPQRKQQKKTKEMLSNMKKGDRVRTIGGIFGTIVDINDEVVTVQVGPDKARLVFSRGAIAQVDSPGGAEKIDPYTGEKKKKFFGRDKSDAKPQDVASQQPDLQEAEQKAEQAAEQAAQKLSEKTDDVVPH